MVEYLYGLGNVNIYIIEIDDYGSAIERGNAYADQAFRQVVVVILNSPFQHAVDPKFDLLALTTHRKGVALQPGVDVPGATIVEPAITRIHCFDVSIDVIQTVISDVDLVKT